MRPRPSRGLNERCSSSAGAGEFTAPRPALVITASRASGRDVCLTLAGELDLASCARLQTRLGEAAAAAGVSVRLDLSRLEFIDSSGLHLLIDAFRAARRDGCRLELEPALREPVARVIGIVGLGQLFWPSSQQITLPSRPGGERR